MNANEPGGGQPGPGTNESRSGRQVLPAWFENYLDLESEARTIRTFELRFVHGLLQTEGYARAVSRLGRQAVTPAEAERHAVAHVNRQKLLTRADPPTIWSVMDEAVLRRPVGGRTVMREQLRHLLEVPGVTLQVVPFGRGDHVGASSSFTLLRFDEQYLPDVVYVDQVSGALYLDQRPAVERYLAVMDQMSFAALTPAASRRLIEMAARET